VLAFAGHRLGHVAIRQFRYLYFIKPNVGRDLRMTVRPYPKVGMALAA